MRKVFPRSVVLRSRARALFYVVDVVVFRLGLQKFTSLSLLLLLLLLPFFFERSPLPRKDAAEEHVLTDHTLLRAFKKYPTTTTTTKHKARNVSFFFFVCVCVRVCLFSPPFSFIFRSPSKSFFFVYERDHHPSLFVKFFFFFFFFLVLLLFKRRRFDDDDDNTSGGGLSRAVLRS